MERQHWPELKSTCATGGWPRTRLRLRNNRHRQGIGLELGGGSANDRKLSGAGAGLLDIKSIVDTIGRVSEGPSNYFITPGNSHWIILRYRQFYQPHPQKFYR